MTSNKNTAGYSNDSDDDSQFDYDSDYVYESESDSGTQIEENELDSLFSEHENHAPVNNINYNNKEIDNKCLAMILDELKNNSLIEYISCEHCELNDQQLAKLADALRNNTTVKGINLAKNNLSNNSVQALLLMLEINISIQEINLDANAIEFDEQYYRLDDCLNRNNLINQLLSMVKKLATNEATNFKEKEVNQIIRNLEPITSATLLKEIHSILAVFGQGAPNEWSIVLKTPGLRTFVNKQQMNVIDALEVIENIKKHVIISDDFAEYMPKLKSIIPSDDSNWHTLPLAVQKASILWHSREGAIFSLDAAMAFLYQWGVTLENNEQYHDIFTFLRFTQKYNEIKIYVHDLRNIAQYDIDLLHNHIDVLKVIDSENANIANASPLYKEVYFLVYIAGHIHLNRPLTTPLLSMLKSAHKTILTQFNHSLNSSTNTLITQLSEIKVLHTKLGRLKPQKLSVDELNDVLIKIKKSSFPIIQKEEYLVRMLLQFNDSNWQHKNLNQTIDMVHERFIQTPSVLNDHLISADEAQKIEEIYSYLHSLNLLEQADTTQLIQYINELKENYFGLECSDNGCYPLPCILVNTYYLLNAIAQFYDQNIVSALSTLDKIYIPSHLDAINRTNLKAIRDKFQNRIKLYDVTSDRFSSLYDKLAFAARTTPYNKLDLTADIDDLLNNCPVLKNANEYAQLSKGQKKAYILLNVLERFQSEQLINKPFQEELVRLINELEITWGTPDLQQIATEHLKDIFALLHCLSKMRYLNHYANQSQAFEPHQLASDINELKRVYNVFSRPPQVLVDIVFLLENAHSLNANFNTDELVEPWNIVLQISSTEECFDNIVPANIKLLQPVLLSMLQIFNHIKQTDIISGIAIGNNHLKTNLAQIGTSNAKAFTVGTILCRALTLFYRKDLNSKEIETEYVKFKHYRSENRIIFPAETQLVVVDFVSIISLASTLVTIKRAQVYLDSNPCPYDIDTLSLIIEEFYEILRHKNPTIRLNHSIKTLNDPNLLDIILTKTLHNLVDLKTTNEIIIKGSKEIIDAQIKYIEQLEDCLSYDNEQLIADLQTLEKYLPSGSSDSQYANDVKDMYHFMQLLKYFQQGELEQLLVHWNWKEIESKPIKKYLDDLFRAFLPLIEITSYCQYERKAYYVLMAYWYRNDKSNIFFLHAIKQLNNESYSFNSLCEPSEVYYLDYAEVCCLIKDALERLSDTAEISFFEAILNAHKYDNSLIKVLLNSRHFQQLIAAKYPGKTVYFLENYLLHQTDDTIELLSISECTLSFSQAINVEIVDNVLDTNKLTQAIESCWQAVISTQLVNEEKIDEVAEHSVESKQAGLNYSSAFFTGQQNNTPAKRTASCSEDPALDNATALSAVTKR